ncbi:MAG: Rieske 2Fe-2S domain-containing protein [Phycisphaeraceae bacterium]|nr:Rieske 2Fe-2S domain-containing protein [Phycisphaeraceae bacterium]MCB9847967.1 Rieske 2Fe-2S domain-containing protein [Phycisphaeraceae bacterium]
MSGEPGKDLVWHRAASIDELPEGRVKTVFLDHEGKVTQVCLTHFRGEFGALDNACPHQGGPLGEGSIENGCLRCPWHGWDFDPLTGKPPGGYDDGVATYPVEVSKDGVYVALEVSAPLEETVTDVMARTMVSWGITHVFGMVGHSNLGLADAIKRRCDAGELEYIGVRHEGAAAFAASAFGKLTGEPAACLTIAGPGATNLLTGLWDAKVDRAPVLALTGQVNQQVFGPGAFQELPLKEAFGAVASFSHLCLPGSKHAELMGLAIKNAIVNRDVAHLIFPDDVQMIAAKDGAEAGSPAGRVASPLIEPSRESLDAALSILRGAKRPVIIVGHGARFEMEAVLALAAELRCPALTTFKAKGLIADHPRHTLGCGVLGRSGTPIASWFMNESDALLVFGASFSNHTGITPKKPTVQVDFDRMQLGRFHAIDAPVWGEIGRTAHLLLEALRGSHSSVDHTDEIAERWTLWRLEKASRLGDDRGNGVSSIAVFEAMNRAVPDDAIIAVDVGNNTYSFGRYFEASGRQSVLMSGYLGSIGFGYPAAMGAWAATRVKGVRGERFRGRPVVCVTGDGGFGQYAWEVNTAVRSGMNITHVLLNNNELGKISKEQRAGSWEVWQTALTNPDIAGYVTSCGGLGIRVDRAEELDAAIAEALAFDGPATVEVMTDAELI